MNDPFAQELRDKMNYGVGRLSPIAKRLYWALTFAFLSHGRDREIKISLLKLADMLEIKRDKNKSESIKSVISNAFNDIHKNTFVKYDYFFINLQSTDQIDVHISMIDNKKENLAIIQRMALNKDKMS